MTVGLLSLGGVLYQDGFAGAPTGTAQYPSFFSGYVTRPPWHVAGVDYAAGTDSTVTFLSPSTLNGAFSGAVTVSGQNVTVSSSIPANSTIQNIDFGVNEGVGSTFQLVVGSGVVGLTVLNCKFAVGTNLLQMTSNNSPGTIFSKCKFNGNGLEDGAVNGTAIYNVNLNNNFTALYCWFLNIAGDVTDYGQNNTIKYCLYDNPGDFGAQGDPHCDWLQMTGGTYNLVVQFNTVRCLGGNPSPSSQGFGFYSNTPSTFVIQTLDCEYNSISTSGGQPKYVFGIGINTTGDLGGGSGFLSSTGTATISNNYIDPTGVNAGIRGKVFDISTSAGAILPGAVFTVAGNINLIDGTIITSSM